MQRGNKLLQINSAKLSERYIHLQTLHDMCSVMFRFSLRSRHIKGREEKEQQVAKKCEKERQAAKNVETSSIFVF